MYMGVKEIIGINEYTITVKFTNDDVKAVDLSPYLEKGLYAELVNKEVFNTARLSFYTIEWANGADIDPEFLFEVGVVIKDSRSA